MLNALGGAWRWARDPEHRRRLGVLERTPLFAGLRRALLGRLAIRLFEKSYSAGEEIFGEGDPGHALFIVASGEVEVLRRTDDGGEERLGLFAADTSFGEMALIDDQPRSADARAHTSGCTVFTVDRQRLEEVLEMDPDAARQFLGLLCNFLTRRIRAMNDRLVAWRLMAGHE